MTSLTLVRSLSSLRETERAWRVAGRSIALVPTMGALHDGHLSLVRLAKTRCDVVVTSLFVNPKQFGPNEDYTAYPRDEARDAAALADAGCDLLYAPRTDTIYPPGFATHVRVDGLTEVLEGAIRPGHFTGVATVVTKLLIQAAPDVAIFGEKDFQQLQVIRRLATDLDLGIDIVGAPIARDADGLALSSRNVYLSPSQRKVAPTLYRTLTQAAEAMAAAESVAAVQAAGVAALLQAGFDGVDYFDARDPETLASVGPGPLTAPARLLCAARLGRTRLLDNLRVEPL